MRRRLTDQRYLLLWLLGVLLLLAVVIVGLGVWSDRNASEPPATATPVSSFPTEPSEQDEPTSSPVILSEAEKTAEASPSPDGTPAAVEPRAGSLPDLLRYVPDQLANDAPALPIVATYADLDRWTSGEMPYVLADDAMQGLALPPVLATYGEDPEWVEAYGFGLTDVSQVLEVGQTPDHVTIMRGAFDEEELLTTWARSGYQAIDVEGVTVWSLFPDDWIDLSAPASRPALGNMNNLVLLEDGTLVAAAKISRLTEVLQVVNNDAASLDEHAEVASLLLAEPEAEDLLTATIVQGEIFASVPTAHAIENGSLESLAAWGLEGSVDLVRNEATALPPIELALIGVRGDDIEAGGATPNADDPSVSATPAPDDDALGMPVTFALLLETPEEADIGLERLIERLETVTSSHTEVPYAETVSLEQAQALEMPDGPGAIVLHAGVVGEIGAWLTMIEARDLGFAEWLLLPDAND